ncbi:MAG TPA: phenylalanine 4-monooxygenase, partial [Arenimonas sp.]|nr:phenylalanine 4-monooxygenase [Arenimonas sp.]
QLMEATQPDFTPIYQKLATLPSFPAGSVQDGDQVFNRGSGEGWLDDGDV